MKSWKKVLAMFLSASMALGISEAFFTNENLISYAAGEEMFGGVIEEDYGQITWSIDKDGKLTVTGNGDVGKSGAYQAPWKSYKKYITSAELNVTGMTDASYLFSECTNLKTVDLSGFDGSNLKNMSMMFEECSSLETIDLNDLDTENVTDMSWMFYKCSSLTEVQADYFETESVTTMEKMFYGCNALKVLNIDGFDTKNVTDMSKMFSNCLALEELDVTHFDTRNVVNMEDLFWYCKSLKELDLSSFDMGKVKDDISNMVFTCESLEKIKTPINCNAKSSLPYKTTWYLPDGTRASYLPMGLEESITLLNEEQWNKQPTTEPTVAPTTEPTVAPTTEPTVAPTTEPTVAPTTEPTVAPTTEPTVAPTTEPTVDPTAIPTVEDDPFLKNSNMKTECMPYYMPSLKIQDSFQMGGITYYDGISAPLAYRTSERRVAFNLYGLYDAVSFEVGHIDGKGTDPKTTTVSVYKDKELSQQYEIKINDLPKKIVCDTTGVNQFEIVFTYKALNGADYGIGALKFYRSGEENALGKAVNSDFLNYCPPYNHNGSKLNEDIMMGGTEYKNGILAPLGYSNKKRTIGFNLQNAYKDISFYVGHVDGSGIGVSNVSISVYKDGILDATYPLEHNDIPKLITCNVENVSQFEIVLNCNALNNADYGIGGLKGITIATVDSIQMDQQKDAVAGETVEISGKLKLSNSSVASAKLLEIEASNIEWTSSDNTIVKASDVTCTADIEKGNRSAALTIQVKPLKKGTVVLTGKASNGSTARCILTVKAASVTTIFTDVYDDWYKDYVQYVFDKSLMTGIKGTSEFRPNVNVSKAQVAQVLYNMESQPTVTNKKVFRELKDVYEAEWYADAVAWAYNTGVVTGDLNTKKFSPNANVTREQLALMLYRYADYKGYSISKTSNLAGLKNAENTSDWALAGVKWAVGTGLISGVEKNGVKDLQPQGNATRAQVAAILQRFCEENNLY